MWKKWWSLFQRYIITSLEYRAEIVVRFFLSIIPTLIVILIWSSIFSDKTVIEGYGMSNMVQYYLLVIFINGLTASNFEASHISRIREGKIDLFFTRPFSFLSNILVGDLASKTMYVILTLPFLLGTWLLLTTIWPIQQVFIGASAWIFFGLCLLIAYAIEFLIALIIVILGFWLEEAEGLEHFKWIVITMCSGFFIPVTFMPQWLKAVVENLPFKYMFSVPIMVIQGKSPPDFWGLWYPLVFIGGLWIFSKVLWRSALKRYASAGG